MTDISELGYPIDEINSDLGYFMREANRARTAQPVVHIEPDNYHITIRNLETRAVLRTYCPMPGCATTAQCWACLDADHHPGRIVKRSTILRTMMGGIGGIHVGTWIPDTITAPIYDRLADDFAMTYGWRPSDPWFPQETGHA